MASAGAALAAAAIVIGSARMAGAGRMRHRRLDFRADCDVAGPPFLRLAEALTGAPVLPGNQVDLLVNGDEVFPAMLDTIRGAERTLSVLTYIYWRGAIAGEIAEAVADRARAGVECRVLLDAVGARRLPDGLVARMRDAGARVELFHPPSHPPHPGRINNRTHRRAIVADGVVGLTGGVGIAEEWEGDAQDPRHWRDDHLLVRESPSSARSRARSRRTGWRRPASRSVATGTCRNSTRSPGGAPAQVLASSPGPSASGAEKGFYLALAATRRSIDLQASYFAPPDAFAGGPRRRGAARRGVRVRVMAPGHHSGGAMVREAGRAAYASLLEAGVQVFEYDRTTLHVKVLVVDGVWSVLGTANFDHRSLSLNDEIALCVQDANLAGRLTASFESDLDACRRIRRAEWEGRGPLRRLTERAAQVFAAQLLTSVTPTSSRASGRRRAGTRRGPGGARW